jgi:tRNA dimethylallyltransferase
MTQTHPPVWILAGPTASGKSAMALEIASRHNGVIINADSMQVYTEIPILSAQPSLSEQAAVSHHLYGHVPITTRMNASQWAAQAIVEIRAAFTKGQQPILVGGSGLYLKTLLEGLSPIPDVPPAIRHDVTALYDTLGPQEFHRALAQIDPELAARLHPTDRQRCIRAREVFEASGKPLSQWQAKAKAPLAPDLTYRLAVLLPDREWLHDRINQRFDVMLRMGAIDEARAIHVRQLDSTLTGMQALGLQSLCDYLDDRLTLLEAIDQGQTLSRQFAKRQYTWFRGQKIGNCPRLNVDDPNDVDRVVGFYSDPN